MLARLLDSNMVDLRRELRERYHHGPNEQTSCNFEKKVENQLMLMCNPYPSQCLLSISAFEVVFFYITEVIHSFNIKNLNCERNVVTNLM